MSSSNSAKLDDNHVGGARLLTPQLPRKINPYSLALTIIIALTTLLAFFGVYLIVGTTAAHHILPNMSPKVALGLGLSFAAPYALGWIFGCVGTGMMKCAGADLEVD